tara:strand:+ start:3787 stop:4203 length:417 start_codon:yes stop_codon:yes gene_type:complete
MIFKIQDVQLYHQSSSLYNVINGIGYLFEDSGSRTGGGQNKVTEAYFVQLDPVNASDCVEYNSLTSTSLKTWVQQSHGNNWGAFTSSVATSISASLSENVNSDTPLQISTWGTGSFVSNTELTQVYFAKSYNPSADWD